jgi:hypothetical protein
MSLGEAFIEVRADLRPFIRDLDREVRVAVERVEAATSRAFHTGMTQGAGRSGEEAGRRAGEGANRGLKKSLLFGGGGPKNIFISIASSLASALDDGISALPTEVKAAIVGGILLAAPTAGAILGAAVTTALGLAVAGLGILLAAQFEQVRDRAGDFATNVRNTLVQAASKFAPAVIQALDLIEAKITQLAPTIKRIFDVAATYVAPLTGALTEGLESFVNMLDDSVFDIKPFIEILAVGLRDLLNTVSEGLRRLANSGQEGTLALRDLFNILEFLTMSLFGVIFLLIKINRLFHDFLDFAVKLSPVLAIVVSILRKEIPDANREAIKTGFDLENGIDGIVSATKREEKAAKDLAKGLKSLSEATYENIQVDIDFERSLDNITESLQENGRTLDIHTEKGRRNVESFIKGLKDAEARAINRIQVQGYTAQQASALYDQEIAQLRNVAHQAGITDEKFDELFGQIVDVASLRISSTEIGVDALAAGLDEATVNALNLLGVMNTIKRTFIGGAIGGAQVKGYADGDIINRPTLGVFGEAGPEVIIPLTQPARAAQLMQESGLDKLFSGGTTQVLVFIGNEQLDSRVVRIVQGNSDIQSRSLNYGTRTL